VGNGHYLPPDGSRLRVPRGGDGLAQSPRARLARVELDGSSFCVEAVEEALARFGTPTIFNTDQGSQFTSEAFTDLLKKHAIQISMDGKGRWRDNVFVERLWRTVKYEEVYLHAYDRRTPDEVYFNRQQLPVAA
jgi:transposase InsO family protein